MRLLPGNWIAPFRAPNRKCKERMVAYAGAIQSGLARSPSPL